MKNIHTFSTNKPCRLHTYNPDGRITLLQEPKVCNEGFDIYITSDEDIKKEDLCIFVGYKSLARMAHGALSVEFSICRAFNVADDKFYFNHPDNEERSVYSDQVKNFYRKVVLTTDEKLIKDGVQAISDEFIEWFIKNPKCESVKVSRRYSDFTADPFVGYEITIPKEEICTCKIGHPYNNACCKIHGFMSEDAPGLEQTSPNTLEEAANNATFNNDLSWENEYAKTKFIEGAKWQEERMYSEEEFLAFGKKCFYKGFDKSENDDANCYEAFREEIGSLFEQFKKKQS